MINLDSNREGQIKVCRYLIFKLFSQATYCILLMNLKLFQEPFIKIFSFFATKGKSEKLIPYIDHQLFRIFDRKLNIFFYMIDESAKNRIVTMIKKWFT